MRLLKRELFRTAEGQVKDFNRVALFSFPGNQNNSPYVTA